MNTPMPPPRLYVRGVGLIGPGLPDWVSARATLRAEVAWQEAATAVPATARLPAAERRRAGDIVKLSLAVADQACVDGATDPAQLATVFSASTGDTRNCDNLCAALAEPDRAVSPTRFTNSVHNASAGYWHIACGSQAPSTSLCAYDGSFAAGLIEACTQALVGGRPVLLVCADVPYPEPLHGVRPISQTMGVALVVDAAARHGDLASLSFELVDEAPTPCRQPALESLRTALPNGRALPLLEALAGDTPSRVVVDYLSGAGLALDVRPVVGSSAGPAVEAGLDASVGGHASVAMDTRAANSRAVDTDVPAPAGGAA